MAFTSRDYSAKFASIQERVSVAGRPLLENMWTAEQGAEAGGCQYDVHVSMHFNRVSDTSWNVGARGAITSICISEYEPLDMRTDGGPRRTDTRTRYSCAIYFFADGKTMYCSEDTRDCYRVAAEAWLEEVRASTAVTPDPVSGGGGA
jgi:hypothetical protein